MVKKKKKKTTTKNKKKPSIKNTEQRQEKVQNTAKSKSRTTHEWGEMEPRKLTVSLDRG